jgi:hypothetical protein
LERREQYIEALEGVVGYLHPALVELVKQCLHNAPRERPNTDDLLARLQRMKAEVEGEYGGGVVKVDINRIKLAKKVKELTLQLVRVQGFIWGGVVSRGCCIVPNFGKWEVKREKDWPHA